MPGSRLSPLSQEILVLGTLAHSPISLPLSTQSQENKAPHTVPSRLWVPVGGWCLLHQGRSGVPEVRHTVTPFCGQHGPRGETARTSRGGSAWVGPWGPSRMPPHRLGTTAHGSQMREAVGRHGSGTTFPGAPELASALCPGLTNMRQGPSQT